MIHTGAAAPAYACALHTCVYQCGIRKSFGSILCPVAQASLQTQNATWKPPASLQRYPVMKRNVYGGLMLAFAATSVMAATPSVSGGSNAADASPIYGVTIPSGYRQWELIAPAEEAAPLNELRAVLGNPVAVNAIRAATLPFPDGTIFVKLAYKRVPSTEF